MAAQTRVGTQLGTYHLRSLLGSGGMGDVYEAYDTVKQRVVALKLLPDDLARDAAFVQRFRREAQSAAVLTEPHVIPIHDWGEIGGMLYIDMRLVLGQSLRALLDKAGRLQPDRAVLIISQVAAALDAAHETGLVHRDIKPENILVVGDGSDFAYLVDFGIATGARDLSLTAQGSTLGTYAYMAPERFDDTPVTGRADTYSLACVLHEALTGSRPYPASSPSAVMRAHLEMPAPRPSTLARGVPPGFDTVIARGMAKRPADRYPTSGEFARAAQSALTGAHPESAGALTRRLEETAVLPPAGAMLPPAVAVGYQQPLPTKHSSTIPVLLTLLIVVVIALGGIVTWLLLQRADSADRATGPTTGLVAPAVRAPTVEVPPSQVRTTTTPRVPPLIGSVAGADEQGFLSPASARCNSTDPAMAIGRTTKSLVVVCLTGGGRYYYKGVRVSDGLSIELDDAVSIGSGFTVTNPVDGTRYVVTRSSLTIVDGDGGVLATEPMVEYASR
ncbi:serine/threonine protein kinase [Aldersonia sp. NBC_00410]|uniref:serine/threonine-protein kinase n=1 Tax=Aldersonia sp. NBC_00410 TaxID=2975954 RepID=UPI002256E2AB|nr:serine/threonine-protein kinase [Aldersonia sp. NBC_00410]MCX5044966.1 serine/threonine protein kinase [Aldersonia sp. NBC_00410]